MGLILERSSVTKFKGSKGRAHPNHYKTHPEGRIGDLYELFTCNRAVPIEFVASVKGEYSHPYTGLGGMVERLCIFWNLDIKRIKPSCYILVGAWDGDRYLDFVAEKVERIAKRRQAGEERR